MGEPVRRLRDIEPDIRPNLRPTADNTRPAKSASRLNNLESNPDQPASGSINDQEATGSNLSQGQWNNSVTGLNTKTKSKISGFFKKKGPLTTVIISLVGGGLGLAALLSPGLLLVQFKEVLVDKFNTQLTSMDIRSTKMLTKKMNVLSGACTKAVSVKCRYSTMSNKQIKKLEKAGITVEFDPDEPKSLLGLGRRKPKGFTFENKTILPGGLAHEIETNSKFRSALKNGFNPKYVGFADEIFKNVMAKFKISKAKAKIEGDTDEEKLKSIQEETKDPKIDGEADLKDVTTDDTNPETGDKYTQAEADAKNQLKSAVNDSVDELTDNADEIAASGLKSAPSALAGGVASTLKVSGLMDNACTAYGTIQAVGYAAKTVRAIQLTRYAMIFLNVADQIKSGNAKPEDVSYLGAILTTEYAATKLTATDSFGYKYAAYGDKGTMSDTAMMFLAGGGLTGKLINVTSYINKILGGTPKTTCKTLSNPFVSGGSLIAGIGLLLFPGTQEIRIGQMVKDSVMSAAISIAISFVPRMLQDIIAGVLVDKTTVGEASGDAIVSGASGMMGTAANMGGNAPLTPSQAVAYNNLSKNVIAQYAEEDRLAYSPFDISNKNTMMGSVVSTLLPYISKMSSLSGVITSMASLTTNSISLLSPVSKATSTDDYTMCQDSDYRDMGLATDPYCNVIYGLPEEALEADPIDVTDALLQAGQIDEETGDALPDSEYSTFISECINRSRPLGDTDSNNKGDGSECLYSESNKNYYIHYIDQRIQKDMDDDFSTNSSDSSQSDSASGDYSQPDKTSKKGKGWTLKDGVDYSGVACAKGTEDKGTYKHPTRGFTIRRCSTPIGTLSSLISKNVIDMVAAAKKDGVTLTGSGGRTYEQQVALRKQNCANWQTTPSSNCSPETAKAGNSMHEKGLASDINNISKSGGGKTYNWLAKNAKTYGFYNFPQEGWHWSTSGG